MAATQTESTNRTPTIIGIVAIAAAVLGFLLVSRMALGAEPAYDLQTEAASGDLSVWVDRYEWLEHQHGGDDESEDPTQAAIDDVTAQAQVFAMPARMMPGTPDEGFSRIQISLNVTNRGEAALDVSPDDFHLESSDGQRWLSLLGGTFSETTLVAGHSISTIVAFDVPTEDSIDTMYLVWSTEDETTRFSLNGSGHAH